MHSENKECDDSVMPASSTLLQITEKGEYLVHLQYFKGGFWVLFVCFQEIFGFFLYRIKQETAALNLLPRGGKTEYKLVQMHMLQKGELRHLASSL